MASGNKLSFTHIKGVGDKSNELLMKYFQKQGISSQKKAEKHLNSSRFHESNIHGGIKNSIKGHFGEPSVDSESRRISNILRPMKNFRENRAFKKEAKQEKKQLKQDLKQSRKDLKQDLRESRMNKDLSFDERKSADDRLKELKGEDKHNRWFRRTGRKVNQAGSFYDSLFGSRTTPNIDLLFFIALAVHIVDWTTGFNRLNGGMLYQMFGLYIFITVFAVLWVFKSGFGPETGKYIGISLIAFGLPFITRFFQQDWVGGVLLFTPVWVLYLMLNPGGSKAVSKIGKIYINFWIIIGIIYMTTNIAFPDEVGAQGVNPANALSYVIDIVSQPIKSVWEGVKALPERVEQTINQSVGMNYYTGEVENSQNAPIGVYLEDLRPAEPVFYEGSPVTIWANLRGKSFKGKILVESRCKTEKDVYGTIDPEEPLEIFYEEQNTLACNFDSGFNDGTENIMISSTFNFETWGYLTYTFVDKKTYRSFYSQDRDIHSELNIPRNVDSVYTNGPVGIGMLALDQPIVVDVDRPDMLPAFGVTLENRWSQGKIERVENFEIRTPEGIGLTRCDHVPTEDSPRYEDGFNVYEFRIQNPKQLFTSVTCRLEIPDSFRASEFLGLNDKAIKTFIVTSKYIYTVEKEIAIDVEEWT